MAFNPFSTFQKNQKFWMAAILMICMITFVFCTGTGADMQNKLIYLFRGSGPTVVQVNRRNLSAYDLGRVRDERNAVNDFMRRTTQATLDNLTRLMQKEREKPVPTDKKEHEKYQQHMAEMGTIQAVLAERLRRPRYFEGGIKLDDLVEFKLWQGQADRLGIRLLDSEVDFLVRLEFFSPQGQFLTAQQIQEAWYEARRGKEIGDVQMRRAVTEEFRARMARLAVLEMQPGKFFSPDSSLPIPNPGFPTEQRLQVSLAKLWDVYKEKRSEFDVTLIPVRVADFTKDIAQAKGTPVNTELQKLFDKYRTAKYDPASPLPSFETPAEVKVEFLMADPTSPVYLAAARARLLLGQTVPLAGAPLQSPLVTAARYAAFTTGQALQSERILAGLSTKRFDLYGGPEIGAAHWMWPLAAYLAERDPHAIAGLVGSVTSALGDPTLGAAAAWGGFLARPTVHEANLIDAALTLEAKQRTLPAARVAGAMASGAPLDTLATAVHVLKLGDLSPGMSPQQQMEIFRLRSEARRLLPLPIIEHDLEKVVIDRMAEQWATRNLLAIKRLLDNNLKPEAVKRIVTEYAPQYHLTHVVTKRFHSRYDIEKAPSLQPLHDSYQRYYREINWFEKRDLTPERLLKEDDFYKLFFDNEPFASTGKYQVRPWPPEIHPNQSQVIGMPGMMPIEQPNVAPEVFADVQRHMQQGSGQGYRLLDRAQRPFLFWRSDDRPPEFPRDLASARPLVVAAWEREEARETKALPLAKKIAEELARNEDFAPLLDAMAVQARQPKLKLQNIAPWVPRVLGERMMGGHREYITYQLPKDTINYPRKDMVQDLLNLYNLQGPLQVKLGLPTGEPTFVTELNRINKALYDSVKKAYPKAPQGHFVQVIPNEPMDTFYVAVVTRPPTPDAKDFQGDVLQFAAEQPQRLVDTFAMRAQQQLAQAFHSEIVAQLKKDLGFELVDPEARKLFDKDDVGG